MGRFGLMVAAVACAACGNKPAEPEQPAPAPEPAAAVAGKVAAPAPAKAPTLAALDPEPMQLPAGQTLGDALPKVPAPAPLLGGSGGGGGATVQAKNGCGADLPDDFVVAKRVEVAFAPAKPGDPAPVLETCLLQKTVERADKVAEAGKQFSVVAAFADDTKVSFAFEQMVRPAKTLPPERQKSGHEGGGWASLIATGDPLRPILAVVSGRFYDGELGEEVHFVRQSRLLQQTPSGWAWQPFAERRHLSLDGDHLRALCAGKADASAADRAAGALQAACDKAQALESEVAKAEARLATRKKRLAGAAGGTAATDADPQSIWLRDARGLLQKGDFNGAIETALQADVVCGEAVGEAHAIIKDALAAEKVEPQRPQPALAMNDLCEPLPDKPAPKRPRDNSPKAKADTKNDKGNERAP